MLLYDNQERVRILFQIEGNVLLRVVPIGIVIGLLAALCVTFYDWFEIKEDWAAKTLGITVSFAIVYRTQISWARYWEAASQLQLLFSKWADCFVQLTSFINTAERGLDSQSVNDEYFEKMQKLVHMRCSFQHNFSLMSALASHRLTHGDVSRMGRISSQLGIRTLLYPIRLLQHWNELVLTRQDLRFNDDIGARSLPDFRVFDLETDFKQVIRAKMQKRKASHDIGPQQLLSAKQWLTNQNEQKPKTSVNRTSLASTSSNVTWSTDLVILGAMSSEEEEQLLGQLDDNFMCSNPHRVSMVQEWICEDLNELVSLCGIPPPIMSRCYQEVSNGMLAFNQAMKVADIPFPMPFAQLLELLLVVITFCIPVYCAVFTEGAFFTPVLSCFITIGFWSLTEIARELENPFADSPNQLPVVDMHERFVELLEEVSAKKVMERTPFYKLPAHATPSKSTIHPTRMAL